MNARTNLNARRRAARRMKAWENFDLKTSRLWDPEWRKKNLVHLIPSAEEIQEVFKHLHEMDSSIFHPPVRVEFVDDTTPPNISDDKSAVYIDPNTGQETRQWHDPQRLLAQFHNDHHTPEPS